MKNEVSVENANNTNEVIEMTNDINNKNDNSNNSVVFTLKELSEKTHINVATIRSWTLKAINGEAYNSSVVNYEALCKGFKRYEIDEIDGVSIENIVITKKERSAARTALQFDDIEVGMNVCVHSYSYKNWYSVLRIDSEYELIILKDRGHNHEYKCIDKAWFEQNGHSITCENDTVNC